MHPLDLSDNYKLAAAIIVGMAFGFVFIKSDLAWPKSLLEAFRLRNGRIIKTVLLTLAAGAVLFYCARRLGLAEVRVRPSYFWGSLLGGVIAGIGMVLCAMTPMTALSCLATGRFYAIWPIVGMLLALPAVRLVSEQLSRSIYRWSEPMSAPWEPSVFWAVDNPALYAAGILIVLLLLVHFTVGDPEE